MAISSERFLSTRDVPKTFSSSTVRKLVHAAWVTGSLIVLAPAATMNGVRYNVSATHYTVVCDKDTSYLYTLQSDCSGLCTYTARHTKYWFDLYERNLSRKSVEKREKNDRYTERYKRH